LEKAFKIFGGNLAAKILDEYIQVRIGGGFVCALQFSIEGETTTLPHLRLSISIDTALYLKVLEGLAYLSSFRGFDLDDTQLEGRLETIGEGLAVSELNGFL